MFGSRYCRFDSEEGSALAQLVREIQLCRKLIYGFPMEEHIVFVYVSALTAHIMLHLTMQLYSPLAELKLLGKTV